MFNIEFWYLSTVLMNHTDYLTSLRFPKQEENEQNMIIHFLIWVGLSFKDSLKVLKTVGFIGITLIYFTKNVPFMSILFSMFFCVSLFNYLGTKSGEFLSESLCIFNINLFPVSLII